MLKNLKKKQNITHITPNQPKRVHCEFKYQLNIMVKYLEKKLDIYSEISQNVANSLFQWNLFIEK